MTVLNPEISDSAVWFAYDGECPLCSNAAHAFRLRKSFGELHLVNARENQSHPFIREITRLGMNLDTGMVLKFQGVCYQGEDALHMMAVLGGPKGWFNRVTALLFRSGTLARLFYPVLRGIRNLLLRIIGVRKIGNLRNPDQAPIFQSVFGREWEHLPPVMRAHYAVRPFSEDRVVAKGILDIEVSTFIGVMSRMSGMLVSRPAKNVPTTVTFRSGKNSADFHFDRVFHYPGGDQYFYSRMEPAGGNVVIEYMRFGIGWKCAFGWDGKKVILSHRGYVWRVFGMVIPIPLKLVIGTGQAEETPLSEDEFRMWTDARHPLFGKSFGYSGTFRIIEVSCQDRS